MWTERVINKGPKWLLQNEDNVQWSKVTGIWYLHFSSMRVFFGYLAQLRLPSLSFLLCPTEANVLYQAALFRFFVHNSAKLSYDQMVSNLSKDCFALCQALWYSLIRKRARHCSAAAASFQSSIFMAYYTLQNAVRACASSLLLRWWPENRPKTGHTCTALLPTCALLTSRELNWSNCFLCNCSACACFFLIHI